MKLGILRRVRNFLGVGYSGCLICGDKWNWKKNHTVQYSQSQGAFPTCEECWQNPNVSNEEIIRAAESLAVLWRRLSPIEHFEETCEKTTRMVNAVKEAVKTRKQPQPFSVKD